MKSWENIFKKAGRYYDKPSKDVVKLARMLKRQKVKRILDLGCGSGRHLVYLAKLGFDVYGFDSSPTGVRMAKEWLEKKHLKAHVLLHDMGKRFPYEDRFFDAIISTQVLHHNLPGRIKATIREIERTIKPKGILFFTVPSHKDKGVFYRLAGFRTYAPLNGDEKGIPHFYFTEELIRKFFSDFHIRKIYSTEHKRFAVIATK